MPLCFKVLFHPCIFWISSSAYGKSQQLMFIQSLSDLTLWHCIRLEFASYFTEALWLVILTPFGILLTSVLFKSYTYFSSFSIVFVPTTPQLPCSPQLWNFLSTCGWFRSVYSVEIPLAAHKGHQYVVGGWRREVKMAQCHNLFRHWIGPGLKYSK